MVRQKREPERACRNCDCCPSSRVGVVSRALSIVWPVEQRSGGLLHIHAVSPEDGGTCGAYRSECERDGCGVCIGGGAWTPIEEDCGEEKEADDQGEAL